MLLSIVLDYRNKKSKNCFLFLFGLCALSFCLSTLLVNITFAAQNKNTIQEKREGASQDTTTNNASTLPNDGVTSLNLCSDQLLLELLPPQRIESLSFLSADPQYSPNWQSARNYPLNRANFEELFLFKSSYIVASDYTPKKVKELVVELDKEIFLVSTPTSFSQLTDNLNYLGKALSVKKKAQQLQAQLANILATPKPKKEFTLLDVGANIFTSGKKTLTNQLFLQAGFKNLAAEMGIESYGYLDIETIITLQPDVIIFSDTVKDKSAAGQRLLSHPAFEKALPNTYKAYLSDAYSACSPASIIQRFHQLKEIHSRVAN